MVPRSRLLPPPTPPVLRRHVVATRRAALRGARLLATATQRKVVDVAGASDAKGMTEEGNILLVEKDLQFKPLERPANAEIIVPGGNELFAASDDPLAHTEADVGKYFQYEPGATNNNTPNSNPNPSPNPSPEANPDPRRRGGALLPLRLLRARQEPAQAQDDGDDGAQLQPRAP